MECNSFFSNAIHPLHGKNYIILILAVSLSKSCVWICWIWGYASLITKTQQLNSSNYFHNHGNLIYFILKWYGYCHWNVGFLFYGQISPTNFDFFLFPFSFSFFFFLSIPFHNDLLPNHVKSDLRITLCEVSMIKSLIKNQYTITSDSCFQSIFGQNSTNKVDIS